MYGQTIDRGDNLVHGKIGTMSCCNNGIGSLGINIIVYPGLKFRLVLRVGQLSR